MQVPTSPPAQVQDQPSKVLNILSFLCPPVGLIVYLSLVGKLPRQALSAGMSAVKGVVTLLILFLLLAAASFTMWLADDVLHLFPAPQDTPGTTGTAKPPVMRP